MFLNYVKKKTLLRMVRWESKLGVFRDPKTMIQETNLGNRCKLSFEVIEKNKNKRKYLFKISHKDILWEERQVLDDSPSAYGNKEL